MCAVCNVFFHLFSEGRTRAKVSILGTDYAATLQEDIDASQLPVEYGGTSGRAIGDSEDDQKVKQPSRTVVTPSIGSTTGVRWWYMLSVVMPL